MTQDKTTLSESYTLQENKETIATTTTTIGKDETKGSPDTTAFKEPATTTTSEPFQLNQGIFFYQIIKEYFQNSVKWRIQEHSSNLD